MIKQTHLALVLVMGLASISQSVNAVTVNQAYINKTGLEISQEKGQYARPTIYTNQRACGESTPRAMACGPYTISVGTQFLQSQENQHGSYAAKMVLAHEWGHSIQFTKGINLQAPYMELQADCNGGSFIRFAVNKLGYQPFLEAAVSSARAAADYGTHGTPAQRDAFTRWGYAQGDLRKCLNNLPR
ncbi:hypothetical protein [Janthinobacterium sp. B9-8]|uniref:hypothetical protein n=1 Tax=Janthinobacterium sp. B9-8 TaxID=1236179 RepID=UPI00061D12D7|nr:hypothetical protein [Janthinobacterium sp. B9-8]AMC33610.1 hypothetical protein VN23_02865 [Janthinobacterium sp. B9-8]